MTALPLVSTATVRALGGSACHFSSKFLVASPKASSQGEGNGRDIPSDV
jgi:hypothetical protein